METKELKIQVPEGYEIDKENSTFECIKLRPIKRLTYEDVAKKLFCHNECWYINEYANINRCCVGVTEAVSKNPINCTSQKQAAKLLAINRMMNVAKYLNGDWSPNWGDNSSKYFIAYYPRTDTFGIGCPNSQNINFVYFKSEELAKRAKEIIGEDTIKLALSTDW